MTTFNFDKVYYKMLKNKGETDLDKIFQSYVNIYSEELGYDVMVQYYGEFYMSLIRNFAEAVEEKMVQLRDKRHVIRRMFSILVEGLQNIYIHGGLDNQGKQVAFLLITSNKENYKIIFGNIVNAKDRSPVKTYLGNMNNHSEKELDILYSTMLKDAYISKKNGGGLGIITMRRKSSKKLNYQIYNLNTQQSCLVLEVGLSKK